MKWLLFTLTTVSLFASAPEECEEPWFTGPLLTPSSHVVPKGYFNFEPYLFYNVRTGQYNDDWKAISQPDFTRITELPLFYLGLTKWMEIQIAPRVSWQSTQGESAFVFDDFNAHLGFQIIDDREGNSPFALKFYIQETFPTGRYQRRDPSKLGTDISGEGSYQTTLAFVIGRMFCFPGCHFLSLRLNGLASIPTNVSVEGVNAFGGAPDTKAHVKIGNTYGLLFGLEYSLTQNWVFAFDAESLYQRPNTFTGFAGTLPDGNPAPLGKKEGYQFTIAPAIEYNFSASLGLIGGVWLSLAGKNEPRFISGVIALNYYGPIGKGKQESKRSRGGAGASGGR